MTKDVQVLLGDPKKALLIMAGPLFVSLIISQLNTFVDTFWCSNLGLDALSAVGVVSSLYFLMAGIGNGLGIGMSVAISKHIGAKEKDVADSIAAQGIVLILCLSLAITPIFLLFGKEIIYLIGGGVAYSDSVSYAYPYFISACIVFAHSLFANLLRAEGAVKRSMAVLVLCVVLNMILDPLFAFVLGMGIAGLAWATVVSTLIATMLAVYWYFINPSTYIEPKLKNFRFDRPLISEFLKLGVPKMVELNIMSVINLALVHFLIICGGATGVALYNTSWRYVSLLIIPSQAFGAGLIPICAAAYGGGNFGNVRDGYNYSLTLSLVITTILTLVVALFSDAFASIFTSAGDTIELRGAMAHTIQLFCIFIPFYAWINISSSLLQAIYMASRSMYSTLIRNLMLVAVFWYTSSIGLEAMWWGLILCEIAGGFLMGFLAEYGLRKRIEVHQQKPQSGVTI